MREDDPLSVAWRALEGESGRTGWRSILIEQGSCYVLRAGRRFPGNLEAVLVGVDCGRVPTDAQLPKGRGFTVLRAEIVGEHGKSWLALCREPGADEACFAMMASDIVNVLRDKEGGGADLLISALLSRVAAWQEFMRRTGEGVLSSDEEIGLFGELGVLRALLDHLPSLTAVEAWVGPLDGLHDFVFQPGAVEVKTTAAAGTFVARIGSLEQLDISVIRPLYIAAVRLTQSRVGVTLPEVILDIRRALEPQLAAASAFEHRLARSGYRDQFCDRYVRSFVVADVHYLLIEDSTPRLVPGNVPAQIRGARYELDLDAMPKSDVGLAMILRELGAP